MSSSNDGIPPEATLWKGAVHVMAMGNATIAIVKEMEDAVHVAELVTLAEQKKDSAVLIADFLEMVTARPVTAQANVSTAMVKANFKSSKDLSAQSE